MDEEMTVVSGSARGMTVAGDMINSLDKFQEMNPPLPSLSDRPSWDDTTLYHDVEWAEPGLKWPEDGRVDISLIHDHLSANCGVSYMEVWIPLARRKST